METEQNKIIEKLRRLLALANDAPDDEEGQNAFLMAQRLMIKHKVERSMISEENPEEINIQQRPVTAHKRLYWWERRLGEIISENFRCIMFYNSKKNGRQFQRRIVFYGAEEDLKLAEEMFVLCYEYTRHRVKKFMKEKPQWLSISVRNSMRSDYLQGFLAGLRQRFEEQVSILTKEYSLVVLRPKEVTESYKELSADWDALSYTTPDISSGRIYFQGVEEGKEIDLTRSTVGYAESDDD
ncbi:DUF2786 domain-containing protein [Aerococcaceae bacterium NML191292]|nr:DUF2786 domain-containing protein [Aerococcaceae bacterium NML191292]